MSEDTKQAAKKREPKKNSIPATEIKEMVHGLPQYTKTSFLVVGHKDGVRLAIPLTSGVSRAYFYGNGNYSLVPDHPAIESFDEATRKQKRKGGIMAEVKFDDLDQAREALKLLVGVVKHAPTPAPKAVKQPKEPKKAKAPAQPTTASELALDDGASTAGDADSDEQLDA